VTVKDLRLPDTLHGLLDDPTFATDAIKALAAFDDANSPQALLAAYATLAPGARQAALATLTARPASILALLDAIAAKTLSRSELSAFTVAQLAKTADPRVIARLNEVWGTIRATPADRHATFDKYRLLLRHEELLRADASRGREQFAKTCGGCHMLFGEGGKIGPDLTGSNRTDLEYLLANLLDPSAVVGRDYQTTTIVTADGRSIAGIVVGETPTSVTLQTPTEKITIDLADVETRALSPLSLMPENQLDQLAPQAARDLVAYLRSPGQVPLPDAGRPTFDAAGRVPGAVEGETLRVAAITAGTVKPQAMGGFRSSRWSNAAQAWWTGGRPGARLVLDVPVTVQGRHEVIAVCTKAHDYGTVTLSWNGGPPTSPLNLFDKDTVRTTREFSLGAYELEPGTAKLTVEITGADPAATPRWMVGIDYLRFAPAVPAAQP
jgi:putative heme-binding domain-containing protein